MINIELKAKKSHAKVGKLQADLTSAKAELNADILALRDADYSLQKIADLLGVKKARAQQLVRQADGRGRASR